MELKEVQTFVITLLLIGMVLSVGIIIFINFSDMGTTSYISTTVANESVVFTKYNTTISLNNKNISSFTQLLNYSGVVFPSENYTVDLTLGTIKLANISSPSGSTLNRTIGEGNTSFAYYTYNTYDTKVKTSMNSMISSLASIPNTWLGIVVIVGIMSVIIGLIINAFGGIGQSKAQR